MRDKITDRKVLAERGWQQSQGLLIEHAQMSIGNYLNGLSIIERESLDGLIRGITNMNGYFRKEIIPFAVLGVGTTTYSEEYWKEIKEIIKIDPSKKKYLENKGEDIDLVFCSEYCGTHSRLSDNNYKREYAKRFNRKDLPSEEEIFYIRKQIKEKINERVKQTGSVSDKDLTPDENFIWDNCYDFRTMITGLCMEQKWKHTKWTQGAPFGASYWKVPEEFIEREKQTVVRVKGEDWCRENMYINIPECRTFHVYLDEVRCASHKIEYERITNMPFAVISRSRSHELLTKAIQIKNGTYVEKKYEPEKIKPWNEGDEPSF